MLGFIGFGNMGSAIFHSLSSTHLKLTEDKVSFHIYDVKPVRLEKKNNSNFFIAKSLKEIFYNSTYIFIAVKPKDFDGLATEIKNLIKEKHILISVIAGITLSYLNRSTSLAEADGKWVRIMPNTPSLVGAGTGAVTFAQNMEEKERSLILYWLSKLGYYYETTEDQMNIITALTGSGPAFVFTFVQALADAAVRLGMGREEALKNASEMVKGSCEFMLKSKKHPYQLRDEVASPGGTTIEGITSLTRGGFEKSIHLAIQKTFEKSLKITKG